MFEELESRRKRLDSLRPLDPAAARRLERVLKPYFIYSSNALEGSTLSLGDTIYILEEGRLPGGKREEEYLEVKGQEEAYRYLVEAADAQFQLSEKLVREFHQLLTQRLPADKYRPGEYKPRDNRVELDDGRIFPYVSHTETPPAMRALITWASAEGLRLHPVELAARLHYNFILIHPFLDGNGRTARVLANLVLMKAGFVPAVFRAEDRRRIYLDALRAVDASVPYSSLEPLLPSLNYFPFVSYLEEELLWSFDRAFDAIAGKSGLTPEDLVKRFSDLDKASRTPLPQQEAERARIQEQAVRELTKLVEAETRGIVSQSNAHMTSLEGVVHSRVEPVAVSPAGRAERFFGIPTTELRGWIGFVQIRLGRRDDVTDISVKSKEVTFAVAAEPHRLFLACKVPLAESSRYSRLSMPVLPDQWRRSEIQQFVVDTIADYLRTVVVDRLA